MPTAIAGSVDNPIVFSNINKLFPDARRSRGRVVG